jgi:hypothetical protein
MASMRTPRTRLLLVVASLILAANLGRQLYRWAAFADERQTLGRLSGELESVALDVMRTQLLADSLRTAILSLDAELRERRRDLARLERRSESGSLSALLYDEYRRRLDAYNETVVARNGRYERWAEVVNRNHEAVRGYNLLADSVRAIGRRMGEPYLSIPSPAEVAVRNGLDTLSYVRTSRPAPTD